MHTPHTQIKINECALRTAWTNWNKIKWKKIPKKSVRNNSAGVFSHIYLLFPLFYFYYFQMKNKISFCCCCCFPFHFVAQNTRHIILFQGFFFCCYCYYCGLYSGTSGCTSIVSLSLVQLFSLVAYIKDGDKAVERRVNTFSYGYVDGSLNLFGIQVYTTIRFISINCNKFLW